MRPIKTILAALSLTAALAFSPVRVQAQTANQSSVPTIKVYRRETVVDVVVTDAKGNPVHGLKQSDFTILEDGKPMKPASFEEHRSDGATSATPTQVEQKLPPNTFTNVIPTPPQATPIVILLIDNLNTPTTVQQHLQQQMLGYIKRMPQGTRMAVLGLTTRLFIVQGITTDKELLSAAIASQKNIYIGPPMEDVGQDPAGPTTAVPTDPACAPDGNQMAMRAQYTLGAMRQIARYLSGMPGRKDLIWFSGSFPSKWDETGSCYDFTNELTAATGILADAHVVINPIESRGLRVDNNTNRKLLEEHYNMDLRAEQTGGHAFYNTNGLAEAAEEAINSGSNFYTLTYTPVNQTLDSRFRSITVKVDRPGINLTYRNGYYAVEPDTDSHGKKIEKVNAMQAAMMRGALDATQILFKVKVAQSPSTEAALPADNQPDAKQMKPPYRHYTISYSIDVHGIDFATSRDGNYRGNFEYGLRVYNADGDEIVNSVSTTVSPILPPTVYRSMLRTGANASQQIDVPATGEYFLRIAVHDLASDRVGTIEVPTASIAPGSASAVAGQK